MSSIHYFQRYSSKENTATNNTLLLFARISNYSTKKYSQLLNELTEETVEVGIEMRQQEREKKSIPDGWIRQSSFKIVIEAKVDSPVDDKQLLNHSDGLAKGDESQKILLLLTKKLIGDDEAEKIKTKISKRHSGIIFRHITYENICTAVEELFEQHESDMRDLVDDYVAYCNDMELFDQSRFLMRIVPCGQSGELNQKYGIYFAPSDRSYTKHQFVGIYANKTVRTIWEIDSIFDADYNKETGQMTKTCIQGKDGNDYDENLVALIKEAQEVCGYEIDYGRRFFCGRPIETEYRKSSSGGIQGPRFVNLRNVIGEFNDASDVARKLKGKKWK